MTAIKLACVAAFIAIMVGLKFALGGLFDFMGPDFVKGALFGGAIVGLIFWTSLSIDRRDEAKKRGGGVLSD